MGLLRLRSEGHVALHPGIRVWAAFELSVCVLRWRCGLDVEVDVLEDPEGNELARDRMK